MERVELDALSAQRWTELVDGEPEPWGGVGEALTWAEKTRYVGLRDDGGRIVAVAGAMLAEVAVEGAEPFAVVGIGGVFVTRRERGRGLAYQVLEPLLEIASAMGPELAMLFCRPALMSLYRKLSFSAIEAPVCVEQPSGRIEIPMRAMWRALAPWRAQAGGVSWPGGRVDVLGLPF